MLQLERIVMIGKIFRWFALVEFIVIIGVFILLFTDYNKGNIRNITVDGIHLSKTTYETLADDMIADVSQSLLIYSDKDLNKYAVTYEFETERVNNISFLSYLRNLIFGYNYIVSYEYDVDLEKVYTWCENWNRTHPKSTDAYITESSTGFYEIVDAVQGEELDINKVVNAPTTHYVDLSEFYIAPKIVKADLQDVCSQANAKLHWSCNYDNGDVIRPSIEDVTIKDGEVFCNESFISEAINSYISSDYNTVETVTHFTTALGEEIDIEGGNYGRTVDTKKEIAEVLALYEANTPVYDRVPNCKITTNDIGNTYVELDLTTQKLYYHFNGTLVLDDGFNSGNPTVGETPEGIYHVGGKAIEYFMSVNNMSIKYVYWMPLGNNSNYNFGMGGATYIGDFGGQTYLTAGSVNKEIELRPETAQFIFETCPTNMPVIIYKSTQPIVVATIQDANTDTNATNYTDESFVNDEDISMDYYEDTDNVVVDDNTVEINFDEASIEIDENNEENEDFE